MFCAIALLAIVVRTLSEVTDFTPDGMSLYVLYSPWRRIPHGRSRRKVGAGGTVADIEGKPEAVHARPRVFEKEPLASAACLQGSEGDKNSL